MPKAPGGVQKYADNAINFYHRTFYLEFTNKQAFIDALLNYYIPHLIVPLLHHMLVTEDITHATIGYFNAYQTLIGKQGCLLIRVIVEIGIENNDIRLGNSDALIVIKTLFAELP